MILVAGGSGQVGKWIAELGGSGVEAFSSADLDVTNEALMRDVVGDLKPHWVINCAAHTAVDAAESEPVRANEINAIGAKNLAGACVESGSRLVHLSTDYVFGNTKLHSEPLAEDHPCAPMSVYGRSKLAGEHAVRTVLPHATVVRTAWVYTGPARTNLGLPGNDFVSTMLELEKSRDFLTVIDDQLGSPTFAHDLAAGLLELVDLGAGAGKTLHAAGGGRASWCDLARAVFEEIGADPTRVQPCGTEEFPRPAPRPAFSVLSSKGWEAAGLSPLRHWRDAVRVAVADR
ncbi:MAG: dTDP-4-dehydrorhamnose reductase [Dietzia psychralcaliphila]